jgi:hypothetical protein
MQVKAKHHSGNKKDNQNAPAAIPCAEKKADEEAEDNKKGGDMKLAAQLKPESAKSGAAKEDYDE